MEPGREGGNAEEEAFRRVVVEDQENTSVGLGYVALNPWHSLVSLR